jgi:hypothetical protein
MANLDIKKQTINHNTRMLGTEPENTWALSGMCICNLIFQKTNMEHLGSPAKDTEANRGHYLDSANGA